ncbi:MAG: hypothetical protein RXR06_11125 [Thermoproteus sp.]
MARRPSPEVPPRRRMSAHDWFTSFGRFGPAPPPPEVLKPAGVYAGGVMGNVRIVEGRRGECCKEPELIGGCVTDALWDGRWGDLAACMGDPVEHMGCSSCGEVCTITLCPHLIDRVAEDVARKFNLRLDVVRDAVRELVLAHEVAHCLMGCLSKTRGTARSDFLAAPQGSPKYVVYKLVEESLATALQYLYYCRRFGKTGLEAPLQRLFTSLPPGYAGYAEWLKTVFTYRSLPAEPAGASTMNFAAPPTEIFQSIKVRRPFDPSLLKPSDLKVQLLDPYSSAVQWATCGVDERPSYLLPPLFQELFEEGVSKYGGTPVDVVRQVHESYSGIHLWFRAARRIGLARSAGSVPCL